VSHRLRRSAVRVPRYSGSGPYSPLGGQGTDTYKYSSGDGWDTLEDSDGQGRIKYDGIILKGGKPIGDSGKIWQEETGGKTFTYILTDWSEGSETFKRLSIQGPDGGLFVKRWQAGQLGIALLGTTPPTPGDILLGDKLPLEEEGSIQYDVWGNIIPAGDAPGREDTLYDTPGDDTLRALAGDDLLDARRGGRNILEGGEGRDRLFGGTGNDELHAEARLTTDEVLALNATQASSGVQGDMLNGGFGDDTLIGGAGNDAQFGGEGRDFIVGGGGNDDIYGDDNCSAAARTWSIGRSVSGNLRIRSYSPDMAIGTAPGNADVLYGGKGEDWIMAGEGNDRVDGGDDNDVLWGDAGADTVLGGNGDDSLSGDSLNIPAFLHGNDLLEGGAGGGNSLKGDNRLDDTGQSLPSSFEAEKARLYQTITEIITLQNERVRSAGFTKVVSINSRNCQRDMTGMETNSEIFWRQAA
jgi:Ca2+-binding RTX toxin-like protein